jgi:hypothetical protein
MSKWTVQRWSKNENRLVYNGCYDNEETAAHASDTLARKLTANGELNHKLNFHDENTEVYSKKKASRYIGLAYHTQKAKWCVSRWIKNENKHVYNGEYDDEEKAARASDTLARKLMENNKQKFKLNFPDDHTEVNMKIKTRTSNYIGVFYKKK